MHFREVYICVLFDTEFVFLFQHPVQGQIENDTFIWLVIQLLEQRVIIERIGFNIYSKFSAWQVDDFSVIRSPSVENIQIFGCNTILQVGWLPTVVSKLLLLLVNAINKPIAEQITAWRPGACKKIHEGFYVF